MRDWESVLRYWKNRHRKKRGTWQAVGRGSIGRLADWKVQCVNELVAATGAISMIDIGCGDGRLAQSFKVPDYLGLDVSGHPLEEARARVGGRRIWRFERYDPEEHLRETADVAISLDVAFHLVDDALYRRHLEHLFGAARRAVGIYSTDFDGPPRGHVRDRAVSDHVEDLYPGWVQTKRLPPPWPNMSHEEEGSDCWWMVWEPAP